MARYIITAPDGTEYPIDATDDAAAEQAQAEIKAWYDSQSNRAVTSEPKPEDRGNIPSESRLALDDDDGFWSELAKGTGQGLVNTAQIMGGGLLDDALKGMGLPPSRNIEAFSNAMQPAPLATLDNYASAFGDYIDGSGDVTFGEALGGRRAARGKLADENIGADIMGSIAGAAPEAAITATMPAGFLGRMGVAGSLGAADNVVRDYNFGKADTVEDMVESAKTGALWGMGGQGVGEGASAAWRTLRGPLLGITTKDDILREAGDSLHGNIKAGETRFGPIINDGKGLDRETILDAADAAQDATNTPIRGSRTKDKQVSTVADNLEGAREGLLGITGRQDMAGRVAPAREAAEAESKELPKRLRATILDTADGLEKNSRMSMLKETQAAKTKAKDVYKEVFRGDSGAQELIDKNVMHKRLKNLTDEDGNKLFDSKHLTKQQRAFVNDMLNSIRTTGKKGKPLSLQGANNFKAQVSEYLDKLDGSGYKKAWVTKIKDEVDDLIIEATEDTDLAEAARAYRRSYVTADTIEQAEKTFRKTDLSAEELQAELLSLSPERQRIYRSAIMDNLLRKADKSDGYFKRLTADKNNSDIAKLKVLFGDGYGQSVDALVENISDALTRHDDWEKIAKAAKSSPTNAMRQLDNSGAQGIVDLMTMGVKLTTGQLNSGTFWSALRRVMGHDNTAALEIIQKLVTSNSRYQAQTILDDIARAQRAPRMRTGAATGVLSGQLAGDRTEDQTILD